MSDYPIAWKFTYMGDDKKFHTVIGNSKTETSAIHKLWELGSEHKCKSIESFFIDKNGSEIEVSHLSGKVKR